MNVSPFYSNCGCFPIHKTFKGIRTPRVPLNNPYVCASGAVIFIRLRSESFLLTTDTEPASIPPFYFICSAKAISNW